MSEKAKTYVLRNKTFTVKERNVIKQLRVHSDVNAISEKNKISRQSISQAFKHWKTSEKTYEAIMQFYKERSAQKIAEIKIEMEKIQDFN
jgi:predicted DNA-binding protein YlxM (UPF0122 family)